MIGPDKRKAIYCLHEEGMGVRAISRHLSVSRNTVKSIIAQKGSLPDCLEITAWTQNEDGTMDEIMGMRHKTLPIEGVQYHPESVLSEHGDALLDNFLKGEQGA